MCLTLCYMNARCDSLAPRCFRNISRPTSRPQMSTCTGIAVTNIGSNSRTQDYILWGRVGGGERSSLTCGEKDEACVHSCSQQGQSSIRAPRHALYDTAQCPGARTPPCSDLPQTHSAIIGSRSKPLAGRIWRYAAHLHTRNRVYHKVSLFDCIQLVGCACKTETRC